MNNFSTMSLKEPIDPFILKSVPVLFPYYYSTHYFKNESFILSPSPNFWTIDVLDKCVLIKTCSKSKFVF